MLRMLGGGEKVKIAAWPQIVYAGMLFMDLGMSLVKHAEPREGKYNFFVTLLAALLQFLILKAGGFF